VTKTIVVRCPHCGHVFTVDILRENPKGRGAHYAKEIEQLSPLHMEILRILHEVGPGTKRKVGAILAQRGHAVSGNSLSGRLSELRGLGLVTMRYQEVKVYDKKTMTFRFKRTPVWSLTVKGKWVVEHNVRDLKLVPQMGDSR